MENYHAFVRQSAPMGDEGHQAADTLHRPCAPAAATPSNRIVRLPSHHAYLPAMPGKICCTLSTVSA